MEGYKFHANLLMIVAIAIKKAELSSKICSTYVMKSQIVMLTIFYSSTLENVGMLGESSFQVKNDPVF